MLININKQHRGEKTFSLELAMMQSEGQHLVADLVTTVADKNDQYMLKLVGDIWIKT